jgi:solute carrier family 25 protein 38
MAGLVAGALSSILLQPLEVVKTRMQSRAARASGGAVGFASMATQIWREEGARSLWAGTMASTVRLAGGIALYFVFLGEVESVSRRLLGQLSGAGAAVRDVLVGGISRGLAAALFCPITVLKTRAEEGLRGGAGGLWTQLLTLARAEGTAGLFAGLGPSLVRDVPYSGISLALLRAFREQLLHVQLLPAAAVGALGGCAAAVCATLITQPADVVRTAIVLDELKDKRMGTLRAVTHIVSTRGLPGLFVGASVRLSRRVLQQSFTWAVFEAFVLGGTR